MTPLPSSSCFFDDKTVVSSQNLRLPKALMSFMTNPFFALNDYRYRIYPFVNWMSGRPSESGHCIAIEPTTFQWMDAPCDNLGFFFCEKSNYKDKENFFIPLRQRNKIKSQNKKAGCANLISTN